MMKAEDDFDAHREQMLTKIQSFNLKQHIKDQLYPTSMKEWLQFWI